MSDPLVEALRRLVEREGGRHVVASRIRVNEQTLYQIIRGIPLPSGKPRGVGATLRAKLTAAYPDWLELAAHEKDSPNTSRARAQPIEDALPVVLDAIAMCPHRDELRTLLALLVDHDAPAYRQRLGELLSLPPPSIAKGLIETGDFAGPAPSHDNHDPDSQHHSRKREPSR